MTNVQICIFAWQSSAWSGLQYYYASGNGGMNGTEKIAIDVTSIKLCAWKDIGTRNYAAVRSG